MHKIRNKLEHKIKAHGIIDRIIGDLSNSELNSLYLELFREQSKKISPADLLKQFSQSRFSVPARFDAIQFKKLEIEWLEKAEAVGFKAIQLSPLAPLGSCSAVGYVNQNNIVSASRTTEVVSDATNVLALQIANDFNADKSKQLIKYCTTHRHTRAQYFTNPMFSAHFGLFCMASGGIDKGDYSFEFEQMNTHLKFYLDMLLQQFPNNFLVHINFKKDDENLKKKILSYLEKTSERIKIVYDTPDNTKDYYEIVRIKIFIIYKEQEIHLVDMGFVNWTQKLLNNKKHRLLTSGAGLELIYKIHSGMI